MYQLTQFKNRPIRRILTAVALVVGALTAAPALATPPSPSPYLVTEIISNCNVGELDIFAHRHRCKRRRDLKRAAHALVRDFSRRQGIDSLAAKAHRPSVGRELAVDQVEARRLACAIGPD